MRISLKEQISLIKRLSFLLHSGVPLLESVQMLQRQAKKGGRKRLLDRVSADVAKGQFLSRSLESFKNVFGGFAINIIRVGETSGALDGNLDYLAQELQKKEYLKRKIIGASLYPAIIFTATIGISVLLTTYILPKILPIFEALTDNLPLTTRILIGMSNFFRGYGLMALFILIALVVVHVVLQRRVPAYKMKADALLLKVPLFGRIYRSYYLANLCRTLSILLKTDVRIVDAVRISAETTSNAVYKKELESLADYVVRGEGISNRLIKRPDLFPSMVSDMVSVGERTGNLSKSLADVSTMYENEVEDSTKNLASLLEPCLMIFVGILVGFIALSIIAPIYELTGNLSIR